MPHQVSELLDKDKAISVCTTLWFCQRLIGNLTRKEQHSWKRKMKLRPYGSITLTTSGELFTVSFVEQIMDGANISSSDAGLHDKVYPVERCQLENPGLMTVNANNISRTFSKNENPNLGNMDHRI